MVLSSCELNIIKINLKYVTVILEKLTKYLFLSYNETTMYFLTKFTVFQFIAYVCYNSYCNISV